MPRFLIEVPHGSNKEACDRAIEVFKNSGSHFVTNADWGCTDDVHKAWITVDLESKEQALSILPPLFRKDASIIVLEKYSAKDLDRAREEHHG